jgi:hypothetical protein
MSTQPSLSMEEYFNLFEDPNSLFLEDNLFDIFVSPEPTTAASSIDLRLMPENCFAPPAVLSHSLPPAPATVPHVPISHLVTHSPPYQQAQFGFLPQPQQAVGYLLQHAGSKLSPSHVLDSPILSFKPSKRVFFDSPFCVDRCCLSPSCSSPSNSSHSSSTPPGSPLPQRRRNSFSPPTQKRTFKTKAAVSKVILSTGGAQDPIRQCLGMNIKTRCRCKNTALMEYDGPQPLHCAEHIHLDTSACYHKCPYSSGRQVRSIMGNRNVIWNTLNLL